MSDEDAQPLSGDGDAAANVTVLPVLTPPGGRLRAAREARGLHLGQVVEALRVEAHLVEAMEANRFEVFDAPVYARGFLRKYAQFLGLSADDMVAELDALARGPAPPTHVPLTTAAPPVRDWSRINAGLGVLVAIVVVLGSFWWWQGRGAPREPAQPVGAQPAAPPAVAETAAATAADAAGLPGAQGAESSPAPVSDAARATEPPGPVAAPAGQPAVAPSPAPADPPAPVAVPDASGADRTGAPSGGALSVELTGDSWVEVYAADGSRQVYGLLHRGDRRTVSGSGPWRVVLGRADQVRVALDGREIRPGAERRKGDTAYYRLDATGNVY